MIIQLILLLHRLTHERIHIYNAPISTAGFVGANTNLSRVVDCSTDGGYSIAPINILTECASASSSLKRMASERTKNKTLSADAHFYAAYRGSSVCTTSKCKITCCDSATGTDTTTDTTTVSIIGPTTLQTLGTLKSTSIYPIRQAIDECAGICYPSSLPTGTTLSDCTITFTGLKVGVWYAVAIQANENSILR
ncbi:unnamed protein product [Rotaria socialis]|uniref:Uncharacterized protein n=2 Tax=Rotaria socialis TaxID=392032 RepID=A0A820RJU4_9BILA|nr:unnamed protein product [Rotaria socialis]CAF4676665.1 unnamed protein product [Rotaria socialis]CAF4791108.1 unnamed protein product [Rotaria socialis]